MNFKFMYKGGDIVLDVSTLEECKNITVKSVRECSPPPKKAKHEKLFIPINQHDVSDRNRSVVVALADPGHDVLEYFRSIQNRNKILKDSLGVKYKLLTLLIDGFSTTFPQFVWTSTGFLHRIGTKELNVRFLTHENRNNYYLPFPIIQHIPVSALNMYNAF